MNNPAGMQIKNTFQNPTENLNSFHNRDRWLWGSDKKNEMNSYSDSSITIRPGINSSTRMKSFILLSTITSTNWTIFGWFKSFRILASVRRD